MNYLVHLSLAFPHFELLAGQFVADLVSKKEQDNLSPLLLDGIKMHKWLDNFSNSDESLSQINKLLHPVVHKYAPVASDILCDYLLYINWEKYFNVQYAQFESEVYKAINANKIHFPEKANLIASKMIEGKWLQQYKSYAGLEDVMFRMNKKAKFSVNFLEVIPVLKANEKVFEQYFLSFYEIVFQESRFWINPQNVEK